MTKQFRGDERRRNRGAIYADKSMARTLGTLMDGTRNQFLPGTCFARDQHRGVGGSDLHDAGKDRFQRGRGADDLLKHEDLIDLLAQREVFIAHPLFSLLAIFDVSSSREPPRNSALFIEQRPVAKQKPAIPPIFAEAALFNLKRHSTCQAAASFAPCSFEIVWMKVPHMSLISSRALHLFKGMSVIVEQHLVRLK